jgi:hypothetical protein
VAVGRDAAKTLKDVLSQSKADADKTVLPLKVSFAVGKIAKFVAEIADEDEVKSQAAGLAEAMEKADGKDHVTLTSTPIAHGFRVRLEVEEGLLKLLGSMGQMMGPQGPDGAPGQAR